MSVNRGLGKGFGSLLPDDFDQSVLLDKQDRIHKILIQDIKPDPKQPRRNFEEQAINELAESIKRYGILQPIVVTQTDDGYTIVAGERRWRAAQKAALSHVPALIRTIEELERLEIGLIENVQRVDLTPLEQALSIARLHEQFSMSHQEIAKRLGKAHTTIINTARLLQLPEAAREALSSGTISEGHGRSILALKGNEPLQNTLLENIIKNKWSVRQAEQFVQTQKGLKTAKKSTVAHPKSQQLCKKFGASGVIIGESKKGGKVTFSFDSHKKFVQFINELTD